MLVILGTIRVKGEVYSNIHQFFFGQYKLHFCFQYASDRDKIRVEICPKYHNV